MDIVQTFYDTLAADYHKLFLNWEVTTREQGAILHKIFRQNGFDTGASILDCACGIGTQAIGLAGLGYRVSASDISDEELAQAKERAAEADATVRFVRGDFRELSGVFAEQFDIVIAMDNALPHMLSAGELERAIKSITGRIRENGIFVGSIRDYDALLQEKPPYAPPYIHETGHGRRVSFQTWHWQGDRYKLTQYMIEDEDTLTVRKFICEYRATRREELTGLFAANGCKEVTWLFPEETGFYQPIVIARK